MPSDRQRSVVVAIGIFLLVGALYAAASMRGGLEPDLLNDAGWWNTRLWIYAVYGLVINVAGLLGWVRNRTHRAGPGRSAGFR